MQSRCIRALEGTTLEPRVFRPTRMPDGSIAKTQQTLASIDIESGACKQSEETKPLPCLPLTEQKRLRALVHPTIYFCKRVGYVWWGSANLGEGLCTEKELREKRGLLASLVRKHLENAERSGHFKHVLTVVEEATRDEAGNVRRDASGCLLFHLHVHFLLVMKRNDYDPTDTLWYERFVARFGNGSMIEKLDIVANAVSYLHKRCERLDLLDNGEYVDWAIGGGGRNRIRPYGPLKKFLQRYEKCGVKVRWSWKTNRFHKFACSKRSKSHTATGKTLSSGLNPTPPNFMVGICRQKGRDYTSRKQVLIRNPQGPDKVLWQLAQQFDAALSVVRPQMNSCNPCEFPVIRNPFKRPSPSKARLSHAAGRPRYVSCGMSLPCSSSLHPPVRYSRSGRQKRAVGQALPATFKRSTAARPCSRRTTCATRRTSVSPSLRKSASTVLLPD